jgi:hypothetical protein
MVYVYNCDGWCNGDDQRHNERPAFTAEFNEQWFRTAQSAGRVAQHFDEGDLVTLCGDCTEQLLLET